MCKKFLGFDFCFNESICESCQGFCCKGNGFVFLDSDDIECLAKALNIDVDEFLNLYTIRFYNKISIKSIKSNGEYMCVFLNNNGKCEIYESRPKQCKSFPFWESMRNLSYQELLNLCPAIEKKEI